MNRQILAIFAISFFSAPIAVFAENSENQTAFGLRGGNGQGYAGGFGYFEVLALFVVDDNRVINVLTEPMYFYQNLAGAWNKNRTRQHGLFEAENVLVVLPSKSGGYYDLQVKALDSKWQRIFSWNASKKRYLLKNF